MIRIRICSTASYLAIICTNSSRVHPIPCIWGVDSLLSEDTPPLCYLASYCMYMYRTCWSHGSPPPWPKPDSVDRAGRVADWTPLCGSGVPRTCLQVPHPSYSSCSPPFLPFGNWPTLQVSDPFYFLADLTWSLLTVDLLLLMGRFKPAFGYSFKKN